MIERHCTWVLPLPNTPEPLYVLTNTGHHISLAIEDQILSQRHHAEQPLGTESCRIVFQEEVGVDNPQLVLQVPERGRWGLFNIPGAACF